MEYSFENENEELRGYINNGKPDIEKIVAELNTKVVEQFLSRRLQYDDLPCIKMNMITANFAPIQKYYLYFESCVHPKTLLGIVLYGYVPFAENFKSLQVAFTIRFFSAHALN